jgi:hypothetical protein
MPEPQSNPQPSPRTPSFAEPTPGRNFPTTAVAIAAVSLAILVAVLVLLGRRQEGSPAPKSLLPVAAYASNLEFTNLQMSESSSMSGGKQTYIEGHITNHGPSTVNGITVQVLFGNDIDMPPQIETGPLNLIYMREPYVDTRPVSASPLAPGSGSDFRLIFDDISDNWNQQLPKIRVTHVSTH